MIRAMRSVVVVLGLVLALSPLRAAAQDQQTLADIRQELTVLFVEIQRLKRELSTTGSPSAAVGGGSVLDRVNAIEAQLTRLTARTEELENRVDRVFKPSHRNQLQAFRNTTYFVCGGDDRTNETVLRGCLQALLSVRYRSDLAG